MASDIEWDYLLTLALWGVTLAALLRRAWGRSPVVGLSLAYWASLAVIHLMGGLIQVFPWHNSPNRAASISGFTVTGYAMAGLLLGNFLYRPSPWRRPARALMADDDKETQGMARCFLLVGAVCYFVVAVLLRFVPSLASVVSNGLNLFTAGCCLLWWNHLRRGRSEAAWRSGALILVIPALTVLLHGFLGFGIAAVVTSFAFVTVYFRPRWVVFAVGPIVLIVGLSLFSVYLDVRNQIRQSVWGHESYTDRFYVTSTALSEHWDWFDFSDPHHLGNIERRLNQNILVGIACQNIEQGLVAPAEGETFRDALLALIPRVLWPDKPAYAGGNGLVSRFTGLEFDQQTSVGIGHVMEFYVNFGRNGVLIGFALLGLVLAVLDHKAGLHLHSGCPGQYILFFVPGQAFLVVGGSVSEMTPAVVGSIILSIFTLRLARSLASAHAARTRRWPVQPVRAK